VLRSNASLVSLFLSVPFLLFIGLTSLSRPVSAADPCSACFAAGYTSGCALANADCQAGMAMIRTALTVSERAMLAATGMEPNTGLIGFPALASAISASEATTTRNIVETLDWSKERISHALRQVPETQNTIDVERKTGAGAPRYDRDGKAIIDRGVEYDIPAPSGLKAALNWRLGGGTLTTSINVAPDDLADKHVPPPRSAIDLSGRPLDQVSKSTIAKTFQQLADSRPETERGAGGTFNIGELVNGGLLLADSNSTLSHDGEFSPSAMADYYLQLSVSDSISPALALSSEATGPSVITEFTRAQVHDFRYSMVYGVLSRYTDLRKPKYEPSQSVAYMHDMIGFPAPSAQISEESILELSSTYRVKSSAWREKIAVDSQYAARELVAMEADLLNIKYRRWQARRDLNLMLAQLLAAELRDDAP